MELVQITVSGGLVYYVNPAHVVALGNANERQQANAGLRLLLLLGGHKVWIVDTPENLRALGVR